MYKLHIIVDLWYNIVIRQLRGEQMKTNKNISIDIEILKEMLEYCEKYNVSFSKLVVDLWTYFKKKNK